MIKKYFFLLFGFLSLIVTTIIDLIYVFIFNKEITYYVCFIVYVFIIICCIFIYKNRKLLKIAKTILLILLAIIIVYILLWELYADNSKYKDLIKDKTKLYSNHNVLLIVPHEDDEINLLGGVIEQYIDYNSKISIVFVTNGDYSGTQSGLERINESLAVCNKMGVCEDNIYFLGYGDQWNKNYPHIYNSSGDDLVISHSANSKTYSVNNHPVYKEVNYTFNNYLYSMKSIILECKADIIFCVDYDNHVDHKATSLIFEKALGLILKENNDYHPTVYKGFAYSTSWEAINDYYEDNILSSKNQFLKDGNIAREHNVYKWSDRERFPIKSSIISRSLYKSEAYQTLSKYNSQIDYIKERAGAIINGDKVFWKRSTSSILYDASIISSSGNSSLLNDYMLIENKDLINSDLSFTDGTCIFTDDKKEIDIELKDKTYIETIVLYDNPSEIDNIISGHIIFDDGETIDFGQLDKYGSGTNVRINKNNVKSFSILVELIEGNNPGITEIEAYSNNEQNEVSFIKLIDDDYNFLYDYLAKEEVSSFGIYSDGEININDISLSVDNKKCEIKLERDKVEVTCPKGKSTYLTIEYHDVSDTIFVKNPRININKYFQLLDRHIVGFNAKKTVIYRIIEDIFDL